MKTFISKYGRLTSMIFAVVIGLILIVSAAFMLGNYEDEVSQHAISSAQYYSIKAKQEVTDTIENYKVYVAQVTANANTYVEKEAFYTFLKEMILGEDQGIYYKCIKETRFIKGGKLFDNDGYEYTYDDPSIEIANTNPTTIQYVKRFESHIAEKSDMEFIGFYVPILESDLCDAIVVYYTTFHQTYFYNANNQTELREFSVLTNSDGLIIVGDNHKSDIYREIGKECLISGSVVNEINDLTLSKAEANKLSNIFHSGKDGAYVTQIGTEDYIVSVAQDSETIPGLAIVELYKVSNLCESSLNFINAIIAIIVVFSLIVISLIIYLIVYNNSIRNRLLHREVTDEVLQCNNRNGFEKEAFVMLDRNSNSYFAVMSLEIRHYQFIKESTNESELNSVLRYIRYSLSKCSVDEESYGYAGEGEFLWLAHAKDRQGLIDRLKVFNSVLAKNKIANKLDILIRYGIYEVDKNEKISVGKMIDYAREANNTIVKANNENAGMQFNFYDVELRKVRIINEDMELRMESALRNGEFQVFYQPKYNLNLNRQDGAEALVRWYDKESGVYNRPDLFMALFESNGFVVKLDKYVFERVCEYINYSVAHGRTVYPVSVNISRVTAIQPEFVEYYTKIKKKYGISDGQIMIEFTESFAYENYKILYDIVEGLHKAGFKCSIDDFGCGYSSYRILKSLPMDEIKLDKFFMERGLDEGRDNEIFDSIIRLAKKLKMKVTQEGVEDVEGVGLLRKMGCDVIQGYIYAHPMALSDYIKFVQTSREHNLP